MKSLLKRRKSNFNEQDPADRPREHIPALPQARQKPNDNAPPVPAPPRFSGAGWEEFLTNVSVPQPPLTPLTQSPGTPNSRLQASGGNGTNPMDDAFRAQLAPPFPGANGNAGRRAASPPAPSRAPANFTNAHMMPPSSPALTNGLGSPIASPKHSNQPLYTGESRFPLGMSAASQGAVNAAMGFASGSGDTFLPPPRLPSAPSSPGFQRSPLSGSPSQQQLIDAQSRVINQSTPGSASSHSIRASGRSRTKQDTDRSDATSIKSNVSGTSISSKGRSISKFFRRKKGNSDDSPKNEVPAIPKLPSADVIHSYDSLTRTKGNRAKGAMSDDLLSPPASLSSHPNGGAGHGSVRDASRTISSPTGASGVPDNEREHMWDGRMAGTPQDSAGGLNGVTAMGNTQSKGTGRGMEATGMVSSGTSVGSELAGPRVRNIHTPPDTTAGSAKASNEQSNRSPSSISSITPNATSPAPPRALLPPLFSSTEGQEAPTSPSFLLPAPSPALRSSSSQSSLRRVLEDMNLPFEDDLLPAEAASAGKMYEAPRVVKAEKDATKPAPVTTAASEQVDPTAQVTEFMATVEDTELSRSESAEEDGTDSISALHNMLGSFDMVNPPDFQAGFELHLTQYESASKHVLESGAPPRPLRPADAPALFGKGTDSSLLSAGPQQMGRARATSEASLASDAYKTPPEEPRTPIMQSFDSMPKPSPIANGTTTPVLSGQSTPAATPSTPNYSRAGGSASLRRPMHAPPVVANGTTAAAARRPQGTISIDTGDAPSTVTSPTLAQSRDAFSSLTSPVRQGSLGAPAIQAASPKRMRIILPLPKPRPQDAALADLIWTHTSISFVQQLIGLLDFNDVKNLRQTSRAFRTALTSYPCKELILRRFLGQVGYRSWPRAKGNPAPGATPQPGLVDPIPLSFSDAEGFLLSHHLLTEYSLVAQAYARDAQGIDPRMLTLAKATTRAYNRVLARLRAQAVFAIPPQRKGTMDSLTSSQQGTASGEGANPDLLPSPWKPGRAALFQVWVPCSNGAWLTDEELTRCEAELFKAGIWNQLKRGDVVWDCALPDECNLGRLIFDGQFLRDLSFTFDPVGHLPSWLNMFSFSPAHFHGRIRSSTNSPVVFIDMTPFREQVAATLHLAQENAETVSPNGTRYRIQRWVYHARVKVTPGTIISTYGLDCVHSDWSGTLLLETEGTIEHARDLITRCFGPNSTPQARLQLLQTVNKGPLPPMSGEDKWSYSDKSEATSPFEIVRAKSKPGQLFLRPVVKAPKMI
ncbi:unnamed protein product [Tilletia controversa]|nr:unnamed protein product [Tilletia controversa]